MKNCKECGGRGVIVRISSQGVNAAYGRPCACLTDRLAALEKVADAAKQADAAPDYEGTLKAWNKVKEALDALNGKIDKKVHHSQLPEEENGCPND